MNSENGMALVEILISIAVVLILFSAATMSILNSQFLASYSRHKTQAMYVAQQLLEAQRRQTFVAASSSTTAAVTLDTYVNFTGTAITTVANLDAYRNQVTVEIDWVEQMLAGKKTMKEFYSVNIANDPVPN